MSKRDMISICDVNKEEALEIFETAKRLKAGVKKGDFPPLLEKRCLAMIFEKPSLRTRCSFEVG
ncbi:MAG TPA: ornithine carbamoyltransferase, partial [Candidatus Sumerlaeia bacterium]|nr:ornithine carbamoyltransferase [Candidatus Sumerlaeia bacterium]